MGGPETGVATFTSLEEGVRAMITGLRPIEHFKGLVTTAIRRQGVDTGELTEFYLSSLLAGFIESRKLTDEPLAVTYIRALGAERELQGRLLKQLGDISLFTSGFFSDSLTRKIVDIDYYISMGETSYGNLASIHRHGSSGDNLTDLFTELATKFKLFVDVLAEVSERCGLTTSTDVLRVYERWLRTKSRRTELLLRELGIEPHDVGTKPVH